MWMAKEEFQTKIESGQTVRYGCASFYKDNRYYYSSFTVNACGEGTESFESFEELWNEVSHYFLYGIDYSENRELGRWPALNYDPRQFNNMCRHRPCVISNYYDRKDDLVIWYR